MNNNISYEEACAQVAKEIRESNLDNLDEVISKGLASIAIAYKDKLDQYYEKLLEEREELIFNFKPDSINPFTNDAEIDAHLKAVEQNREKIEELEKAHPEIMEGKTKGRN